MTEPKQDASTPDSEQLDQNTKDDRLIDPLELVNRGGYRGNPREIVENPAVAPETLEPAPEDLRPDLFRDDQED
jgi:hypothetical protein